MTALELYDSKYANYAVLSPPRHRTRTTATGYRQREIILLQLCSMPQQVVVMIIDAETIRLQLCTVPPQQPKVAVMIKKIPR